MVKMDGEIDIARVEGPGVGSQGQSGLGVHHSTAT